MEDSRCCADKRASKNRRERRNFDVYEEIFNEMGKRYSRSVKFVKQSLVSILAAKNDI